MEKIKDQKITIEVVRPNGQVEIINITDKFPALNKEHFSNKIYPQIQESTFKAGKGEVIGYNYSEAEYKKEESDYNEKCTDCKKTVDIRNTYSQKEWTRFGGHKVQVIAYYCKDCHRLLSTIGNGEVTEMEHRASEVPSQEMINKEELI